MKILILIGALLGAWAEGRTFRDLFANGDFSEWGATGETSYKGYQFQGGILSSTPKCQYLVSAKEYGSFHLKFEFKLTAGANNGLGILYPGVGDPAKTGIEIQILDDHARKYEDLKPWQYHGSLYFLAAAKRGALRPAGAWNEQEIILEKNQVTVILNGDVIIKQDLKDLSQKHPEHEGVKRRSGHLVFCGHKDVVHFRKVRLSEDGP